MTRKFHMKQRLARAALAAGLAVSSAAFAAGLPKEGSYGFNACFSGVGNLVKFSKDFRGVSFELLGANRSDVPGGMLDHTTFRCVGAHFWLGGKDTLDVLCETVDPDGDKQLAKVAMAGDGRETREVLAGTGKYEGMQMTGAITPLGKFPSIKPGTFQACNHQIGTYKLK